METDRRPQTPNMEYGALLSLELLAMVRQARVDGLTASTSVANCLMEPRSEKDASRYRYGAKGRYTSEMHTHEPHAHNGAGRHIWFVKPGLQDGTCVVHLNPGL